MGDLTIGQIARKAKVNTSTIRYYESIGLLPKPKRVNGQRRYSGEILNRIRFIKICQQAGFRVREIYSLLEGFEEVSPSERWRTMAAIKCAELKEKKKQIDTMICILEKGLKCHCLTWADCLIYAEPDRTGEE
ncbi:MerR family transcriptional regulator [Polycladomyces sp. WAk]|uniref:MerR family transcriptional regulator n=1 Tax=Polycladomyces zharkentensis TaxID=2807616 RepID=A0ABS2WIF7_9BACL|nr:MerR family transcriptional regulator [Polycladomyces sp. WAk]MBN2909332.1 MerR family transcriptional regulator [Polycladomyces sp. WAk]